MRNNIPYLCLHLNAAIEVSEFAIGWGQGEDKGFAGFRNNVEDMRPLICYILILYYATAV